MHHIVLSQFEHDIQLYPLILNPRPPEYPLVVMDKACAYLGNDP
jgi:hypothetical protein